MVGKKLKGKNLNMFGNPIHQPTKEYKEGWNRIFGKKEQDELKESYKQSLRNKKERTEISNNYISAKIYIQNNKKNEATKILKSIVLSII